MKLDLLKRPTVLIAAGVILLACVLQVLRPAWAVRLENITEDERIREATNYVSAVATNLGFVEIRDSSITAVNDGSLGYKFGLYWPRQVFARATRELFVQGAKLVAFDVMFGELRTDQPGIALKDDQVMTSDAFFSDVCRRAGNVILAAEAGVVPPPFFRTNALAVGDISADRDPVDGVLRRARAFQMYKKWHVFFQQIADDPDYGVNLSRVMVEPDKLIFLRPAEMKPLVVPIDAERRFDLSEWLNEIPPGMEKHPKAFTEDRIWHMGIRIAAQALGLDLDQAQIELDKGRITLRGTNGVERVIPVDSKGFFSINWAVMVNNTNLMKQPIQSLLANDGLRMKGGTPKEELWKGRYVVVGSTATGNDLTDRGTTPLEKDTFLASKHWNVANSIITNQFITRAGLPVELALICVMGIISAVLTCKLSTLRAALAMTLLMLVYIILAFLIYVRTRYFVPIFLPVVCAGITNYVVETAYRVVFEERAKQKVRGVFSKMLPPEVVNQLLARENLKLGGERTRVTVLFADVRGFTTLTDVNRERAEEYILANKLTGPEAEAVRAKQAEETLHKVNSYLAVIAEQVMNNEGTVDKFIGDCVMAFWGAPVANTQHALGAVRAAIGAQRAVFDLNREAVAENRRIDAENMKLALDGKPLLPLLPTLSVGTGINTGEVTAGLMGWEGKQMSYTVFGREVNVASRLEGVSGYGRIIISEATLSDLVVHDSELAMTCAALEPVKVKGIREAVRIYEVPWRTGKYAPEEVKPEGVDGKVMAGATAVAEKVAG